MATRAAALIALVTLLAACERSRTRLDRTRSAVAEATRQLVVEPESISTSAVDQRFRARRDAVAAMRADLRQLVAVESAFVADSGRPTTAPLPPYGLHLTRGNLPVRINLTADGWWATIGNVNTAITCVVFVGPDTSFGSVPRGEPICRGEKAWRSDWK